MAKAPKLFGCARCPVGSKKDLAFRPFPPFPDDPKLLVVVDDAEPRTMIAMKAALGGLEAETLIIPAVSCRGTDPTTEVLSACREAYVHGLMGVYAGVPLVACGETAASSVLGGRRKLGNLAYDVKYSDGRLMQFSWSPLDRTRREHLTTVVAVSQLPIMDAPVWAMPTNAEDIRELFQSPFIVIDVETENPPGEDGMVYPWKGGILRWVGLSNGERYYVFPVTELGSSSPVATTPWLGPLREELAKYSGTLVGHNIKGDLVFLAYYGLEAPNATIHDTYVYEKCRPLASEESLGLKWLAKRRYSAGAYEARVHAHWDNGLPTWQISPILMAPYLAGDLYFTHKLYEDQASKRQSVAVKLSMDYLPVIAQMEVNGFAVDQAELEAVGESIRTEKEQSLEVLKNLAMYVGLPDWNPNSPSQVLALLAKVGIQVKSTNEETLREYQEKTRDPHWVIDVLLKYRLLAKKASTYIDVYRSHLLSGQSDGRIHAQFGVQGTESGRLNCRNPNLQNPPVAVRGVFVSRYPGGKLIDPDVSALEYRLIAHASQDPRLCRLFLEREDIHIAAAKAIWPDEPVTKELRNRGKTCNYAGVYECGPEKFYKLIGREDLRAYHRAKQLYPKVNEWKKWVIHQLRTRRKLSNMFGRTREFPYVDAAAEREGINWLIQSAGHDLVMVFTMEILDRLAESGLTRTLLVNEVHDEPVFDSPSEEVTRATEVIRFVGMDLTNLADEAFGVKLRVPVLAEVNVLERWA